MPRMRVIKPEFFDDRKLARCSRDARLLYVGLWTQADEWSRVQGDPRLIKGKLFAYDDDLDQAAITKLLDELAADDVAAVVRYDVAGDPYIYLPKLIRHQRLEPLDTPSRLPEPPDFDEDWYLSQPNVKRRSGGPGRRTPNKSGDTPTLFGDDPDSSGLIHVSGIRGQVSGVRSNPLVVASDDAPTDKPRRGTRLPEDFAIPTGQRDWFATNCPHVDVRVEHQKFVNFWTSKAGQGATKLDWIRTWQNWMLKAEQDAPRNADGRRSTTDDRVAQAQALKDRFRQASTPQTAIEGTVLP